MVQIYQLLALPPALLGLILHHTAAATAQELEWPYNLPPHVKYYPEDEGLVKRNLQTRQKLQQQMPVGIKKMSGDPGEKFLLDYWQFDGDEAVVQMSGNASIPVDLAAPLHVHAKPKHSKPILPRILGVSLFDKRAFECPAGSLACTSIDRPNSCCGEGSTCQLIQDIGLGDVGCCAADQICGGSVSTCPDGGYTTCPQSQNGGCCLPGYACYEEGCIATSTAVVIVTPTPTPTPSSSPTPSSQPPPPPSTTTETTVVAPPPPPPSSSSASPSPSSSPSPTPTEPPESTPTPPNTLVCSTGFRSCPASLGGGCCPTDRACGSDVCPEMDSTGSFTAPGRPTSDTASATVTSISSLSSIPGAECPTGYYACSAFYQGGCCQTGRNCETTSCPTGGSVTVVDGSSITAVAPTGSGISSVQTLLTGSCAQGWSTCPPDIGGGCCPTGYACGSVCTATATGGQGSTVGKIAPNEAGKRVDSSQFALVVMGVLLFGFGAEMDMFG